MWGDENEAVAPIIWLYQTVDAQKEEVSFPNLLLTLRRYGNFARFDGYDVLSLSEERRQGVF